MIDGIGVSKSAMATTTTAKNPSDLSSDSFLTLLLAQYKYQDPFAPQDPTASLGQLSGLTQLSTLQEISGTLNQFLETQRTGVDVSGWIGRNALVVSKTASPLANGEYAGALPEGSDTDVDVTFTSADGRVLKSFHLPGPVKAGQAFSWDGMFDGTASAGPVTVTATSGSKPVMTALWTPITGVSLPTRSNAQIETAIGQFAPDAVLRLD